jgi:hypothetical protein
MLVNRCYNLGDRMNKLLNAVIALLEDRPEDAREMLRSPEVKAAGSISQVKLRLFAAVYKQNANFAKKILRGILCDTLRLEPKQGQDAETFLSGIVAVEDLIAAEINKLQEEDNESET